MDNDGNFREQSEAGMMKAVSKGELSVKDFYERKADMAASVRSPQFSIISLFFSFSSFYWCSEYIIHQYIIQL